MSWDEFDAVNAPDDYDWRNMSGKNYLAWNKN